LDEEIRELQREQQRRISEVCEAFPLAASRGVVSNIPYFRA
jgi:hypothetical protein